MKPTKITFKETTLIDRGTKKIYSYPMPTKSMSFAYMLVNGRNPEEKDSYFIDHECEFLICITKGDGTIYCNEEIFDVKKGDLVYVPKNTRFAVEGKLEYVSADAPAFYPEQLELVKKK